MSYQKYDKLVKFIEIFDQMSKDLDICRLTNYEKDILLSLYKNSHHNQVDIRNIDFKNFYGQSIPKSSLYKSLKNLCNKNIITHLGSQRSSIYELK